MKFMLDTNICIYLIKKKPESVLKKFQSIQVGDVGISAITLAELQFGVYHSAAPDRNGDALNAFIISLEVAPFDEVAALYYGRIRSYLQAKGVAIGAMDMLIAAHAQSRSVVLVTNNLREFVRIPDLFLENWIDS
jgi:tRNA(fMet)-specific endonuclease VapC